MSSAAVQSLQRAVFVDKRRVTFVTGAGISVRSGIPLYRSGKDKETLAAERAEFVSEKVHQAALPLETEDDGVHVVISDDEGAAGSFEIRRSGSPSPTYRATDAAPATSSADAPSANGSQQKQVDDGTFGEMIPEFVEETSDFPDPHFERTAIWDAKLELLATKDAFLIDPRNWFAGFWFDTHHVDGFLTASPNESHFALAAICNDPSLNVTCITQNVDNLHRKAGMDLEKLVEIHGRIGVYRCTQNDCYNYSEGILKAMDLEFLTAEEEAKYYEEVETLLLPRDASLQKLKRVCTTLYEKDRMAGKPDFMAGKKLPCCPLCRAPVLPITLLFDESYTTHAAFQFSKAMHWIEESDILVFCGTSFSVYFTEQSTQIAREMNKEVFNLNIKMDVSQFFGFHTLQSLPPLTSSTTIGEGRKVLLNFDSDSSADLETAPATGSNPVFIASQSKPVDGEDEDDEDDSPLFSSSSSSSPVIAANKISGPIYRHTGEFPVIHHLVGEAYVILQDLLTDSVKAQVRFDINKVRRAQERRIWDVPSTYTVTDSIVSFS